jgi:hypothetical protein
MLGRVTDPGLAEFTPAPVSSRSRERAEREARGAVGDPFPGWVRQPPVCDRDRMARDYGAPAEPQVRPAAPRAGHGTVLVNRAADGT